MHRYDVPNDIRDPDHSEITVHTQPLSPGRAGTTSHIRNGVKRTTSCGLTASQLMSPMKSQQNANSLTKLREAVSEGRRTEQHADADSGRKWFEGPINRSMSTLTHQHQNTSSASYQQRPPVASSSSSVSGQRVVAQNLDIQLSVLFDQQNALFNRTLGEFEARITSSLAKLDARVGNVEETVKSMERAGALETRQLQMDRDDLKARLQAEKAEKDSLAKRLLAAQTANSSSGRTMTPTTGASFHDTSPGRPTSPGLNQAGSNQRGSRFKTPTGANNALRNLVHAAGVETRGPVTGRAQIPVAQPQQQPGAIGGAVGPTSTMVDGQAPQDGDTKPPRTATPNRAPPPVPLANYTPNETTAPNESGASVTAPDSDAEVLSPLSTLMKPGAPAAV